MTINGYQMDEEEAKAQYENIDSFIQSMLDTYELSQLRALIDGCDKYARSQDWIKYLNDPEHRNTVVFAEGKYGIDAYCIAGNLRDIIDLSL